MNEEYWEIKAKILQSYIRYTKDYAKDYERAVANSKKEESK